MRAFARRYAILLMGATCLTWVLILAAAPPAGAILGCGVDPLCIVSKGIGGAVSSVAGDVVTQLAKSVLDAVSWAVKQTATLWMGIGTPQLSNAAGQPTGAVGWLQENLVYLTSGLAVFSVLVGAAKIALEEQKAHHARELTRFLVVYGMIAAGSAALGTALVSACDQIAGQLITQASGNTGFADHMAQLLGIAQAHDPTGTAGLTGLLAVAFAAVVLGIIAFLTTVVQILLMFVRGGMLVLLIGTLPLAAAMSNTEMGMNWFKKSWAWLIAFALYKPAAAVVYAVAFVLPGQTGITAMLSGIMMLVLAVLALPALLRFVVPATAAVAGGSGTGAAAAGAAGTAMMMRMPTGAAQVESGSASSYDAASASSTGGGQGATGAATAGPAGGSGMNGSSGGSGASGRQASNSPAGAASTNGGAGGGSGGPGSSGGQGATGAPGAAGNSASTAAGTTGGGGSAAGGGAAAGAAGGVAGAAYGAYQVGKQAGDAIKRAGEESTGDGPSGAGGGSS